MGGPLKTGARPMGDPWANTVNHGGFTRDPCETNGRSVGGPWHTHGKPTADRLGKHYKPMGDPCKSQWRRKGGRFKPVGDP